MRLNLIPVAGARELQRVFGLRVILAPPRTLVVTEADVHPERFLKADGVLCEKPVGRGAVQEPVEAGLRKLALGRRKAPTEPERILDALKLH